MRIKLTIAYEGTNYCGWQIQKNALTVQEVIEEACTKLFSREIKLIGASRTDTGVHALGQVAVIDVETKIPPERIAYALNTHLPEDIVIQKSEQVPQDFHPRYDAKEKTYEYLILNQPCPLPQYRRQSHYIQKSLDRQAMRAATRYLIGEQDFQSFCSANTSVKSTIRTIYAAEIVEEGPLIKIRITGNGFLYNMVRIIAGTLMDVGLHRLEPKEIETIIKQKDRCYASATAPAKGLTLVSIKYN